MLTSTQPLMMRLLRGYLLEFIQIDMIYFYKTNKIKPLNLIGIMSIIQKNNDSPCYPSYIFYSSLDGVCLACKSFNIWVGVTAFIGEK
jgi:hypothetical protein